MRYFYTFFILCFSFLLAKDYSPLMLESHWPDFCRYHLLEQPEHCCEHDSENELTDKLISRLYLEEEELKLLLENDFPDTCSKCSLLFCKDCKNFVTMMNSIKDKEVTNCSFIGPFITYECNCSKDCFVDSSKLPFNYFMNQMGQLRVGNIVYSTIQESFSSTHNNESVFSEIRFKFLDVSRLPPRKVSKVDKNDLISDSIVMREWSGKIEFNDSTLFLSEIKALDPPSNSHGRVLFNYRSVPNSRKNLERDWVRCANTSIVSQYLNHSNQTTRDKLYSHLSYLKENKNCSCFWHTKTKEACEISNFHYNIIEDLCDKCYLEKDLAKQFFPCISLDGNNDISGALARKFYIHCFWYSQYVDTNSLLLDLIKRSSISRYNRRKALSITARASEKMQKPFLELYSKCLSKHSHPKIYYERGLLYNHMGDYVRSLYDMKKFFEMCPEEERTSEIYLQEGSAYNECGMYDAAIKSLSTAIELDPENFDAYFERAYAYFETGDFDKSIEDYIASGKESSIIADSSAFGIALTKGLAKGSFQSGKEFVPALLYSVYGIGHGLWSLATDPVATSTAFTSSAKNCFLLFMESTFDDKLALVVPEIANLKKHWKSFSGKERGEALGFIIGKYGIDILMNRGSRAALRYGKSLRKANFSLTLSAMKKTKDNKKALVVAALKKKKHREKLIKKCNTKIQPDKQGKHIAGHRNYENHKNRDTQSIFKHKKSQKLIDEHVFTGKKVGSTHAGKSGYKEEVDFKEFIGWAIDPSTGKKYETTYGTIHHAKDGVHIIPKKPPGV